ncbi:MAG: aldehyde ferredoxin oxidoreductase, partial [Nitrospina sp.]|nr:aldehyde ferredoxin oxidoreductase [Nitrospina sp.]
MDIIRVDMAAKKVTRTELPKEYKQWGGRGLTSLMINKEVDPECDPLGPGNKLIIAPGFLSGTGFVNTSRVSIGAKSPLTGGIKESNAGGTTGALLGRLGIGCIVFENQPKDIASHIFKIDKAGTAELLSADNYKGMRTYTLVESLHR